MRIFCFIPMLLLTIGLISCSAMFEEALIDNLENLFVSDVLTETSVDSATLRFTTNIPTVAYAVYGIESGNYVHRTDKSPLPATTHTITVNNLTPNVTYYAKVFVESPNTNEVKASGEVSFSIFQAESLTITVSNLTFTPNADLSSGTITWQTNVATTHSLEYGTSPGNYTHATVPTTTPTQNHSISISGLSSNTTYYYRVRNYHDKIGNAVTPEQQFTITEPSPTRSQKQRGFWLLGGLSGTAISTVVSQIDLYDPVTDTWYPNIAKDASGTYVPVSFASVTATNGKIYVIGGFRSDGTVSNSVQIYDVQTNSWSSGSSAGFTARANVGEFLFNNKIYILAGTTGNATAAWASSAGNQIYDIASNSWSSPTAVVPASSERYGVVLEGSCYFMGGRTAAATLTNVVDAFIISLTQLSTGVTEVALPSNRTGQVVALFRKQGYPAMMVTVGGFSAITGTTGNYVFQGATTSTSLNYAGYLVYPFVAPAAWTAFTNQYPLSIGFAAAIVSGDYLYVFGGATSHSSGGVAACYKIDLVSLPSSNWSSVAAMPVARFGHGVVKAY
ncbi:MAG: fibronectin type III domain-containing protein [Spirochaetes bacterium]|nr:fibronectin type III domain-containing protein [Spirochaetota bacterium]